MNNDDNIINSNGEVNGDDKWGTWEELILTCAVKRHGLTNWDSVSKEISSLTSLTTTASAANCEIKYKDLKRRFNDSNDVITESLRCLRIDELKRDVQRSDHSIQLLELRVKKLEEEKEEENPDLGGVNRFGSETVKSELDRDLVKAVEEMSNSGEEGESEPLINVINMIRYHSSGSVFESRLRCQETKNYKSLIRQHLDIKTIEKKLEKGSSVSSSLLFYRDLKLLFTNAIVYFPTSSSEAMAAHELRTLVDNEMKKQTGKSGHNVIKAEAESSVSKVKSSVQPLVACKKKSSASKKMSPSSSFNQKDEKKSQEVVEEKTVNPTTTTAAARRSRRTSKGNNVVAKDTKTGKAKKQTDSKTDSSDDDEVKEEKIKTEKKIASEKKKSVADFLKRIKKNSPQKVKETMSKDPKEKKSDGNVKREAKPMELRSNTKGKKKEEEENNSSKSTSKRKQPKKEAEEVATTIRKRGRESGKDNKQQPKKRGRR